MQTLAHLLTAAVSTAQSGKIHRGPDASFDVPVMWLHKHHVGRHESPSLTAPL